MNKLDINQRLQDAYGEIHKAGNDILEYLKEQLKDHYGTCRIYVFEKIRTKEHMTFPFAFEFKHKLGYITIKFGLLFNWERNEIDDCSVHAKWEKEGKNESKYGPIKMMYDKEFFDIIKSALKLEIDSDEFKKLMESKDFSK